MEKLEGIDTSNTCTEETLLYQLVSGLHTSINMHVNTNFIDFVLNKDNTKPTPNLQRFVQSIGKHPERLKNLFFLYAVTLRAINLAQPILNSYDYNTQIDIEMDSQVPNITETLFNELDKQGCTETFQEKYFFS